MTTAATLHTQRLRGEPLASRHLDVLPLRSTGCAYATELRSRCLGFTRTGERPGAFGKEIEFSLDGACS